MRGARLRAVAAVGEPKRTPIFTGWGEPERAESRRCDAHETPSLAASPTSPLSTLTAQKIELDVGRRDLTVRELFRTAAFMANEEFVVRHGILPGNPPSSVAPATAPESRESFSVVRHSDNSSHKK